MKYYVLTKEYVNWLKQFDEFIENIDYGDDFKPYLGVALTVNGFDYFIPLSSFKLKYKRLNDDIDFLKITNSKPKDDPKYHIFGALNINNMIPVPSSQIEILDMTKIENYKKFKTEKEKNDYIVLLSKEYKWIKKNKQLIQDNAQELYDKVTKYPEHNRSLVDRCCKWTLLEQKCGEYDDIQK